MQAWLYLRNTLNSSMLRFVTMKPPSLLHSIFMGFKTTDFDRAEARSTSDAYITAGPDHISSNQAHRIFRPARFRKMFNRF